MSENILVVEYEPRYTDRVRQALAGNPSFVTTFARDGEEAIRALEANPPRLIVLSSVIPKISTSELIRAIRGRKPLQETPILLTVSGYNGKSPRQDAQRVGASDILPKPYSETEFLGKVQQMLGFRTELDPDLTVRLSPPAAANGLTSTEIFGDLIDDSSAPGARKTMATKKDDVDKLLADTLAGVLPKKKDAAQPPPGAPAKRSAEEMDQILNDTLSGLKKPTTPGTQATPAAPRPAPAPPAAAPAPAPAAAAPATAPKPAAVPPPPQTAAPQPAAPRPVAAPTPAARPATPTPAPAAPAPQAPAAAKFNTEKMAAYVPDRVPVSQPVFPQAVPAPPAHEEDDPSDGTRFGQYVLIEKIATGGMAEVWKSRMKGVEGFEKVVAIKKILPHLSDNQDFIEMFIDEAKLAAQLNHNNIIHIYDLGKMQGSYYIAMEYIDGHDLKTILRRAQERDQPMTVELALFIASKIAAALDYAHRKRDFEDREMGIVHRDVSPQNVLVSQDGDIKLCDFGIAKAASKASHTQAGALKGKLQYMSPEQAWGRNIDKRSDIFALAAVLFEMLTARKLFTGDSELSILEQVREARVVTPSDINDEVTPEIDRIVLKALHKDPQQRYQTAGELARELDAVLYSFRPTPTSADLAIYMHRIWSPEPVLPAATEPDFEPPPPTLSPLRSVEAAKTIAAAAPVPIHLPTPAPAPAPAPVAAAPAPAVAYEEPPKKKPVALFAILGLLVLGGGAAAAYFLTKGGDAPAPAAQTAAATTTVAPVAAPTATTPLLDPTTTAPLAAPGTVAPVIDPNAVDAEVQKRLAAQRALFEQQQRTAAAQQQAANASRPVTPAPVPTATQAPVTPAPAPVQQPQQTATQAPAPVPTATQAAEAPRPTPQPAAEERVREGDLVSAGTPGLIAARVTKRGTVPYPAMARASRVQGTVIVSVLVSETGKPLEVRVLRGVARPVGLNEAAEQTMRRSTFAPATKDGVRVKTWLTVPVDFKL
ncbi:MAG TPA: TonB family protein [Thermoanaerobaculia bacterium]